MDPLFERLMVRAATNDELLSGEFEILPGQKGDADLAAKRLAAWCRSCASGNWSLFRRRLERDQLSIGEVLERFSTVRRKPSKPMPTWVDDVRWIDAALQTPIQNVAPSVFPTEPCAFEHLFATVIEQAEALLWNGLDKSSFGNLSASARAGMRQSLLRSLSELCALALYERFVRARKGSAVPANTVAPLQSDRTGQYDRFIADMQAGGIRGLFEQKPVLLRLVASVTRQWIDASRALVMRLDADLPVVRRDILSSTTISLVSEIKGELSDLHNGGQSVQIVSFEDGKRVVYKPKDLRLDVAWHALIERLNHAAPPVDLKAARAIACDGYGWTEFIGHAGCEDEACFTRFFRRAGALLALFHILVGTDMHQENVIAAGDYPVAIDLEMILQATDERNATDEDSLALRAAADAVANSVTTVGLLPSYVRSPNNQILAVGGMEGGGNSQLKLKWIDINSDAMRPAKIMEARTTVPNLPHLGGKHARLDDHLEALVSGFEDYTRFLLSRSRNAGPEALLKDFAELPVRRVLRSTRFYHLLLDRLRNHRNMDDGVLWSAQADFLARLTDWDKENDPFWPLQQAERAALLELNVPHFVSPCDGSKISSQTGISIFTTGTSGMDRARMRIQKLQDEDITWQVDVIRQSRIAAPRPAAQSIAAVQPTLPGSDPANMPHDIFVTQANKIAEEVSQLAIRKGPGAAWIGLDWLGDSEVFQLLPLGVDLYNGSTGISIFLAAHAAVIGCASSGDLALLALSHLRKELRSRNAARFARTLGIGGATGLGSVVYALAMISKCLGKNDLLESAHMAAELFTDDLIAADKQLDVLGGSAGAILALLRLYRDTQSKDVLTRAVKCGEHLLAQRRSGVEGRRSWGGQDNLALNGMAHGAAGFAYALVSLAAAASREDFAEAAFECIAFENFSYDSEHSNWPDFRSKEPSWRCQWCHGSPGIGLARIATHRQGLLDSRPLLDDVERALNGLKRDRPRDIDTLCCGTLGVAEFVGEAGHALERNDLCEFASQQLTSVFETAASAGDYRWTAGKRRFNLGLFRGLAGVGYTYLRQVDRSLPNILVWE